MKLAEVFFFFFWLSWIFLAARGLSLVVESGGYSSLWYIGFSLRWLLLLQSMGSRRAGSVVVAHGLSCSAACGIFPDQGSKSCPLHWQVDPYPLRHQGSPEEFIFLKSFAQFHWAPRSLVLCHPPEQSQLRKKSSDLDLKD